MGDLNEHQLYKMDAQDRYIWFGASRPIWYLSGDPGEEETLGLETWVRDQVNGSSGTYVGSLLDVIGTPVQPCDDEYNFSGLHEGWLVFHADSVAWHMWRDPSDGLYYVTLDDRFTHAGDEEWWVADLPDRAERPFAPGGTATGTLAPTATPQGVATVT